MFLGCVSFFEELLEEELELLLDEELVELLDEELLEE